MSASFYRNHDQWLQMQGMAPNLHTFNSHRSSLEPSKQLGHEESRKLTRTGSGVQPDSASKIFNEAQVANERVKEMRNNQQEKANEDEVKGEDSLRKSASY